MDMPQAGSGTLTPQSYRFAALKKSQELAIPPKGALTHGVMFSGLTQGAMVFIYLILLTF